MPVTLIPAYQPPDTGTTCVELDVQTPGVSRVEGQFVYARRRGLILSQGQYTSFRWQFLDVNGDPVDLSLCTGSTGTSSASSSSSSSSSSAAPATSSSSSSSSLSSSEDLGRGDTVVVRFAEAMLLTDGVTSATATVVDSESGLIECEVPSAVLEQPGVELAEIGLLNSDGKCRYSNKLFIWVDRSLFLDPEVPFWDSGPPDAQEVWLALRDSAPEDNFLLRDKEFDVAELCEAYLATVRCWNEMQPRNQKFSTASFQGRGEAMQGIIAQLMMMASAHYLRNDLQYSNHDVSIADKAKYGPYMQRGQMMWDKYTRWVRKEKYRLSMQNAFYRVGSPYGRLWRWRFR